MPSLMIFHLQEFDNQQNIDDLILSWGAQWGIGGGYVIGLKFCMRIEEKRVKVQWVGQKWTL